MNTEQTNHHVEPGCPNNEYLSRLLAEEVEDYAVYVAAPSSHINTWNPGATHKGATPGKKPASGRSFSIFYLSENQRTGKPQALAALANDRAGDEWWQHRWYDSHFGMQFAFGSGQRRQ